ncbi:beta-1,4-N-acetylgalactosaminyltransferase bre-4-like [Adelges cooleyi]|uniref:beta-1,4-N-acetylgalactosaminyltransferase bre-4-like n=1 Tax=Adelges cooleyi TaxID=133065 RepID=UPI00217F5606|nr:beta-1,4-N-acetylgalactosaminyltransferase bre-4-like [Adelges cooleyi]XP_050422845.1 beta-1,4-N-acetylgalactosaminyltransferase bre-4-like [Adelges cooleyi]XP_050422853.1 beta-1,4-N-acetylgalactosaminyltransferase bre-4-like [Adelges cooleyi]XP_050422862.1 beta-1,4-N-acetylgalactosaminyltransferase bre-4-like [Adelges cooleyi]XP_050422870.1 beta-1,4-N-acetylgalactosaminyltransferase bre-4-like [Adelges cooleyi]
MLTTPTSQGRLLVGLGVVYVLAQYMYVTYNNEPRRFDNLMPITSTQEYVPATNAAPIVHLNVSEITSKVTVVGTEGDRTNNKAPALCPEVPPGLNGTVPLVLPTHETLKEVAEQLSWLRLNGGGHKAPTDCEARYKIAIIVPYRDRLSNLCTFLLNIHPFLTKQQLDYTIFIIEQFGDGLFNRAMLMNVGFVEALKLREFDCFFFHDVDLIPENDKNIYSCPQQPRHMSVAIDKFKYRLPYKDIFGGVVGMSRYHFQLVNGFSNMFWGWGGEDDDMASRVKSHELNITRYPPDIARYHMLSHAKQRANPKRYEKLFSGRKRFKTDGLNHLAYQVKSFQRLSMFTYLLVDITKI